jgi:hypothetical protein
MVRPELLRADPEPDEVAATGANGAAIPHTLQ